MRREKGGLLGSMESAPSVSELIFEVPRLGTEGVPKETLPSLRDSPAPKAFLQSICVCPHATPPLLPKRSAAAMRGLTTEMSFFFSISVSVFEV